MSNYTYGYTGVSAQVSPLLMESIALGLLALLEVEYPLECLPLSITYLSGLLGESTS